MDVKRRFLRFEREEKEKERREEERRRNEERQLKGEGKGEKGKATSRNVGNFTTTSDDYSSLPGDVKKERQRLVSRFRYYPGQWYKEITNKMDAFNDIALNSLLKTAKVMQRGSPKDKRIYVGPDADKGGRDRIPIDVKFVWPNRHEGNIQMGWFRMRHDSLDSL